MIVLKTPILIYARDYHDFDNYRDAYRAIGLDVLVTELGFDGQYRAIVHSKDLNELDMINSLVLADDNVNGFKQ